jgi:hypothetical protein
MVCSFRTTASSLLSPDQAQTLFHEFGHALHSILSRTQFQHHSGKPFAPAPCLHHQLWASMHRYSCQSVALRNAQGTCTEGIICI